MAKAKTIALGGLISLVYFLMLPFPFERGWSWFGGYFLLRAKFPMASGFDYEINLSNGIYASIWYPVLFVIVCLGLAWFTFILIAKIRSTNVSSQKL